MTSSTVGSLMDLLGSEPERIEAVLGDAVTENLPQILISVFNGDAGKRT